MTSKVYRTAQGKSVDLGTIMLQNEHVRAVGNMNVNARGDRLDSENQVIETKTRQIQRQNARVTSNVSTTQVDTSSAKARKNKKSQPASNPAPAEEIVEIPTPVAAPPVQEILEKKSIPEGGLAAAIARSREVKQELEKTRRQQLQAQGLKKI
jgi:hypothetical protein